VHTLLVHSKHIYTKLGVPVNVQGHILALSFYHPDLLVSPLLLLLSGVAQVKIESENLHMLHTACQQFLGRTQQQIEYVVHETLEGHQRGIIGAYAM
jgi:hypothetical protein